MDGARGSRICRNASFSSSELAIVEAYRERLIAQLVADRPTVSAPERQPSDGVVVGPIEAYQTLFRERLDPYIVGTVTRLYAGVARKLQQHRNDEGGATTRPPDGFIYVFRDERDAPNVYKIGSTRRTPERRVREWAAQLEDDDGGGGGGGTTHVRLLFSHSVPLPIMGLVEQTLHTLLFCAWEPRRIDRQSGRRLLEYFRVSDLTALRYLVRAVVRHAAAYFSLAGSSDE